MPQAVQLCIDVCNRERFTIYSYLTSALDKTRVELSDERNVGRDDLSASTDTKSSSLQNDCEGIRGPLHTLAWLVELCLL
jgi:hypothetical protein